MIRRELRAAERAQNWISKIPITSGSLESQLLVLLALNAAAVINPKLRKRVESATRNIGMHLPPCTLSQYRGDPTLAMAVQALLIKVGVEQADLQSFASAYAEALNLSKTAPGPELALVALLVRSCGFEVLEPLTQPFVLASATELMTADRKQILETCRLIAMLTGCGTRHVQVGDLPLVLPSLCISYAADWDLEVVCTLLRTNVYLGTMPHPACRWALEWLLDQQQDNGCFGLFAPEARHSGRDPNSWQLYFHPTVSALFSIAETIKTGFLIG
jgi:hypothetical protein